MNMRERINAVLHRENPDQVPWLPFDGLFPRGTLELELRNKGMGLVKTVSTIGTIPSPSGDITREMKVKGDLFTVYTHTPVGTLSQTHRVFPGKQLRYNPKFRMIEPMIKTEADYDAAIYIVDSTEYYSDDRAWRAMDKEIGDDGIVRDNAGQPPYAEMELSGFFGFGPQAWFREQLRHPHEHDRLFRAFQRRADRRMRVILKSPAECFWMGSLGGNYGPHQWEKYDLPWLQKYTRLMHKRGKILCHHAHASNLNAFRHLIAKSGLDVIDAFTPSPVGDLSVAEARKAWGDDMIIWVNFPETLFYKGVEYVKKYTRNIILSDPPGNRLAFGLTEMGAFGITDEKAEAVFTAALRAITEEINKSGRYPVQSGSH